MQPGQGIQALAPDHERLAALIHKGEVFAFPLEVVREVVPMSELLTPVCSDPCVMGFILLRGVQVPVMDLSGVMHYGGQAGSETYTSEQHTPEQSDVVAILPLDTATDLAARGEVDAVPFDGDFRFPEVGVMELRRSTREPALDLFLAAFREALARRNRQFSRPEKA